ncbi:S-layer homology domain-containing protein [Paenibacillus marchantiophytorum]|uniref:S-layer homology domain-containing protein n=1 Tax=Paenibacillus marchantiophytorum TaxID=1619310 RepID=UPI00166B044E|nr:S-layer homology domain-containing protein [Paenibacillus marchantiophytorum]
MGENGGYSSPLDITRTVLSDLTRIDKTILDEASADRILDRSRETGEQTARILMDAPAGDVPDEFAVEIVAGGVSALAGRGLTLRVESETANLTLDNAILRQMMNQAMDVYFRIVPVRDELKRQTLANRVLQEQAVRQAPGGAQATIVGTPQKIETNYSSFRTKLTIPFNGIVPPTNQADFLNSLRVFIEHSDGEKKLVTGTIVNRDGAPYGIQIEIDKFSTFTLVKLGTPSGDGSSTGTSSDGSKPVKVTPALTKAELSVDEGHIVIDHDGGNEGLDKDGFKVTVDGKPVRIVEVVLDQGRIKLILEPPAKEGQRVEVTYAGDATSDGAMRKKLFSGLAAQRGKHSGFVFGYPDGTFKPENAISRAEMAALLSRVYEGPKGTGTVYSDMKQDHWANEYIADAARTGLMRGYPDGTFRPSQSITRAEMASIIAVWKGLNETAAASASDTQGHWGVQTIARVMAAGVMNGYPDRTFQPDRELSRAEAVTIIDRLLQRGPLSGVSSPTWSDVPASHWAFGYVEEASTEHRYERLTEGGEKKVK